MTDRRPLAVLAVALILTSGCGSNAEQPENQAPSLRFEEEAAGRAALGVYEASQDLALRAWAEPAQDWTSEVEQVAADPYRSTLLADLAASRDTDVSSSDLTTTDPTVADVDLAAGVITVTDCLNGTVVDAEVHRADDGRWLVTEHTPNPDQSC